MNTSVEFGKGFLECAECAAKPGHAPLCTACLNNRAAISVLKEKLADAEGRAVRYEGNGFLERLRGANLSRLPRYGHGSIHTPGAWGPMNWGCALAGEVGELCNVLKKWSRQMSTDPSRGDLLPEIGDEIADVAIYLDLTAAYFNFDLARCIELKFNRSSRKFGFPERM